MTEMEPKPDSPDDLLAAAANGEVDIVPACFVVAGDLERLDEWSDLGFIVAECGCIVRIGGPFDPHSHRDD
jgi:hypothetical protein